MANQVRMGTVEKQMASTTAMCAPDSKCDGITQRQMLCHILELGNQRKLIDFAWGSETLSENTSLKSIKIKIHQESFPIPVSRQNIGNLKAMSESRLSSSHTWAIDASKICDSTFEDFNLSHLVAQKLQLPEEMKVTAQCTKLVVYDVKSHFIFNSSSRWIEGKFGTATLQLPVEGGHEGGSLNVQYGGRKKRLQSHNSSDAVFYLSVFPDSCEHFSEPVLHGNKLVLVYDLLWTNTKTGIPKDFPLFLGVLKKIKESLEPWLRNQFLKSNIENENGENLKERLETPPTTSDIHCDSSEVKNHLEKRQDVIIAERTLTDNVFLFVLQESYDDKSLSFGLLRGQDRLFAEILLNCDFLDVHLAMASQSSSTNIDGKVELIEVTRVIDSDDEIRNLSIQLKWEQNVVGLIQSDQEWKLSNAKAEKDISKSGKVTFPCGVLLIWPRHHSVQMYCRYGLHSFLIRMSKSLTSLAKRKDHSRTETIGDLSQLISYCRAEPRKVWTKSGMKKGELTLKLLHFCITLRASEKGLDLLKILSSKFDGDSQDTEMFEGIQTEDVAEAIANFERQVCDWNKIAELIKAMVTHSRIVTQLIPITKLAKFFLDFGCLEGAKTVGDCILSWFDKMDTSLAWKSKCCDVEALLHLLVALQSNPETTNRTRTASFLLFFSKLRPFLQFRLLFICQLQHGFPLKTIQSWQFVYRDACEIFSFASSLKMPPIKCMAVDFMLAIEVWLSELLEAAGVVRHELLHDSLEPQVVFEFAFSDPVLEQLPAASVSSYNAPTANSQHVLDDWGFASNSSAGPPISTVASSSMAGIPATDDWGSAADAHSSVTTAKSTPRQGYGFIVGSDFEDCGPAAYAPSYVKSKKVTPQSGNGNAALSGVDDWCLAADAYSSSTEAAKSTPRTNNVNALNSGGDDCSTFSRSGPIANVKSAEDDWGVAADAAVSERGSVSHTSTRTRFTQMDQRGVSGAAKCNAVGHMSYNCTTDPNRGRGGGRGGGSTRSRYKCNEDGHSPYSSPTRPTRGRGGVRGGGGGSTHRCVICHQEGHYSYNCPNHSTGGRRARNSPASSYGVPSSSAFDDWGTLTATPDTKSSSFDSGEKKNDWRSASNKASSPWATGANGAPRDARRIQTLRQTIINPVIWTGIIKHRDKSFNAVMKSLDVNAPSLLTDLKMPTSMTVMGNIEHDEIWTYLRKVTREATHESIYLFQLTPANNGDLAGYKFIYDEFNNRKRVAVIADNSDSKLPSSFKDFYVVPLGKERPIPSELTEDIKNSFWEDRKSDVLLGVVVFKSLPPVAHTTSYASLSEKKAARVPQSDEESESIQTNPNAEPTLVASAQPPNRRLAIRQKLQEDITILHPVKAKLQSNSSRMKSPLQRPPSAAKTISVVASPVVAESNEDNTPVKTPPPAIPFNPWKPSVDGKMLMLHATFEERHRQMGATKHGQLAEATESVSSVAVSGLEPSSSSGPTTRSKSKRKPAPEKMNSSQLQEPQNNTNSMTPPTTSSDESWEDLADYCFSKRRKSSSSGGVGKPSNLADDTRVPVTETKTGKVLCGDSVPIVANVEQRPKANATYTITKQESLPASVASSFPKVACSKTSSVHTSSTPLIYSLKSKTESPKKPSEMSSSKSKMTRKRCIETSNGQETPTKMAKSDPEAALKDIKSKMLRDYFPTIELLPESWYPLLKQSRDSK